ncbi:MAG TPA: hypothetical protein VMZ28_23100 [Kofleriaceae bacterium]|nr:hypothetical protein [Kofleriaceae bacterium]
MRCRRLVCLVVALGACDLDVDYRGTAFRCEAACPSGQECVGGVCRAPGEVPDAAPGAADAGASAYALAVLADDPILYLPLDEPANAIAAIDASGEGRDGAYLGGAVSGEPGAFPGSGTAVHFDGLDDRVVVQDDEVLRLNGDF